MAQVEACKATDFGSNLGPGKKLSLTINKRISLTNELQIGLFYPSETVLVLILHDPLPITPILTWTSNLWLTHTLTAATPSQCVCMCLFPIDKGLSEAKMSLLLCIAFFKYIYDI